MGAPVTGLERPEDRGFEDTHGARPGPRPVLLRFIVHPAFWFVLVGGIAGSVLALQAAPFRGLDENGHFGRAYQMSEGRFVPIDGPTGSGACLPIPVMRAIQLAQFGKPFSPETADAARATPTSTTVPAHLSPAERERALKQLRKAFENAAPKCAGGTREFYEFSTFAWYPPLGYAPAAGTIALGRAAGAGPDTLLRLGRFGLLAAYLAVGAIAIRRAPYGRWALCVVGLLPAALLQAAVNVGPDALTLAFSMLIVATALKITARLLADPDAPVTRRELVEAIVLTLALSLCKPTYWLVGLAFLLPWIIRPLRARLVLGLVPAAAGAAASFLWQRSTERLFTCDVVYFDITPASPGSQVRWMVSAPWEVVAEVGRFGKSQAPDLLRELVEAHPLEAVSTFAVVVALLVLVAVATVPAPGERDIATRRVRLGLAAVGIVGVLGVIGGFALYCSPSERVLAPFAHPRHFLPALVALVLAIVPGPRFQLPRAVAWLAPVGLVAVTTAAVVQILDAPL